MGKQVNLTVAGIESRMKKGRTKFYSDAGARGLYLKTTTAGTGSWVFRWRDRATGKLRDMGLGTVTEISLAEARELAGALRKEIRDGGDPIAQRHRKRQERMAEHAKDQTFEQVCESYYAAKVGPTGLTEKHKARWKAMMQEHVYPKLGAVLVRDIDTSHVLAVLNPIWASKLDTARRVRQNMEKVWNYARVSDLVTGPNPATWKGHLDASMAAPRDIRKAKPVQHHRAVPWREINPFVIELRQRDGMAARALEFAVLTAARSGEVRHATWSEIDLAGKQWVIPEGRMRKNGKAHTIPLSEPAVKLLKALPRHEKSSYVFWAPRGGALTDMALSAVLRRMDVDATVHGFRSTFKDWCRNATNYADEVSELALSHVNSDATRAAYARDELIEPRTRLMRKWSRFIDTKPAQKGTVTPINSKAS